MQLSGRPQKVPNLRAAGIPAVMALALAPPAIVSAVAGRFWHSVQGIASFRLHRVFDVHAGPRSRHDDIVFDGVYDDGRLVNMRIVSYTIGGQQADAQQQADFERDWVQTSPKATFHLPFDPRFLGDYHYRVTGNTVAFAPLSSAASNGSGVFTFDGRHNVVSYTYAPSVMPEHATSGTVSDQRAEVLPDYWSVTHETQQYKGRYALWTGGATVEITWTNFRRYASLRQAVKNITRNR
jgi:hypothetical protein